MLFNEKLLFETPNLEAASFIQQPQIIQPEDLSAWKSEAKCFVLMSPAFIGRILARYESLWVCLNRSLDNSSHCWQNICALRDIIRKATGVKPVFIDNYIYRKSYLEKVNKKLIAGNLNKVSFDTFISCARVMIGPCSVYDDFVLGDIISINKSFFEELKRLIITIEVYQLRGLKDVRRYIQLLVDSFVDVRQEIIDSLNQEFWYSEKINSYYDELCQYEDNLIQFKKSVKSIAQLEIDEQTKDETSNPSVSERLEKICSQIEKVTIRSGKC